MSVCWECDRLTSRHFGHQVGCSMPNAGEAPAELPGPFKFVATLNCGHTDHLTTVHEQSPWQVGAWLSCWNGEPGRCQAMRRVVQIEAVKTFPKRVLASVASASRTGYTGPIRVREKVTPRNKEEINMPGRTKAAAAPAPVEPAEGERDYSVYAEKAITATMTDFADWIVEEVYGGNRKAFEQADPERIVALAGTLRMEFQASDLNIQRREERRQARATAAAAPAEEEAAPTPRPRRGRAAAAAAEPAEAPAPKAATPKPGPRRGRTPAAAAAPY